MAKKKKKKLPATNNLGIGELIEKIKALEEENAILAQTESEYNALIAKGKTLTKDETDRLNLLQSLQNRLKQNTSELEQSKIELEDSKNETQSLVSNTDDLDDSLVSIANQYGSQSNYLKIMTGKYKTTQNVVESIGSELQNGAVATQKTETAVSAMSRQYVDLQTSVGNTQAMLDRGDISTERKNELIKDQAKSFLQMANSIDLSDIKSKDLLSLIERMKTESQAWVDSIEKVEIRTQNIDNVFESFSGVPVLTEINKVLKTNIKDTLAWKAAIFAVGAALGKAAFDYFGAPIKVAQKAQYEIAKNQIETAQQVRDIEIESSFLPQKINQEINKNKIQTADAVNKATIDATFAAERAINSFNTSMQSAALEFSVASKTALFGKAIGSIGYGAAQMQMAGIGADKVASAMQASAIATGKMPTAAAAADMAILADRTGQSQESIAQLNEYLERTDGVSAKFAMNMQEGMRAMADNAGLNLANFMQEVAAASKDALGYQIKSGPALAKAVAYTQSMGLNFQDVAKAGKNMVMNYKDSIKAEMQLSTLLGEQVDLSEVRAKFAEGDTEGALKSLQAQGLNPEDMDMFQQEALSQALGGMDLSSLSKIATKKGTEPGELKAGNVQAGNQQFLTAKVAGEKEKAVGQANISAAQAIIDASLSGKITEAYLKSPGYLKYQQEQANLAKQEAELAGQIKEAKLGDKVLQGLQAKMMKLDFVQNIKENLMEGFAMIAGGVISSMVSKLLPKGGLFGGGTAAGAAPTTPPAAGVFGGKTPPPPPIGPSPTTPPSPTAVVKTKRPKAPKVAKVEETPTLPKELISAVPQKVDVKERAKKVSELKEKTPGMTSEQALTRVKFEESQKSIAQGKAKKMAELKQQTPGMTSKEAMAKVNESQKSAFTGMAKDVTQMKAQNPGMTSKEALAKMRKASEESTANTPGAAPAPKEKVAKTAKPTAIKPEAIPAATIPAINAPVIKPATPLEPAEQIIKPKKVKQRRAGRQTKGATLEIETPNEQTSIGQSAKPKKSARFMRSAKPKQVVQQMKGIPEPTLFTPKDAEDVVTQTPGGASVDPKSKKSFKKAMKDKYKSLFTKEDAAKEVKQMPGGKSVDPKVKKSFKDKLKGKFSTLLPRKDAEQVVTQTPGGASVDPKVKQSLKQKLKGKFGSLFQKEDISSAVTETSGGEGVDPKVKKSLKDKLKGKFGSLFSKQDAQEVGEESTDGGGIKSKISGFKDKAKAKLGDKLKGTKLGGFASALGIGGGAGGDDGGGGAPPELPEMPGGEEMGGAMKNIGGVGGEAKSAGGVLDIMKGIGPMIGGIMEGIATGLKAFADPMVVAGGVGLAAVIVAIGAGIAGASWILGKALPTLAEGLKSFNEINGENLKGVGLGMAGLGIGIAAFGAGSVLAGIGGLVGGMASLFGGKSPIDQFVEFSKLPIDGDKVKTNAEAFGAFAKGMAIMGGAQMATGIGSIVEGIGTFFGGKPPFDKFVAFSKLSIDSTKVKGNAEAFGIFAEAMSKFDASGSLSQGIGMIVEGVGAFFGGKTPIDKFVTFSKLNIDGKKAKINAEAFTFFADALSKYKGGGQDIWGTITEAVGRFLKNEDPIDKFEDFSKRNIDGAKAKINAEAFTQFANALSSYKGTNQSMWGTITEAVGSFLGNTNPIDKFEDFAKRNIDGPKAMLNAQAFTFFADALSKYKGTNQSMWGTITEAVGSFLGNADPIDKFESFAKRNIDGPKAMLNALAFTQFADALGKYTGTNQGMWGTITEAVGSFLGNEDPIDKFENFSKRDIDGQKAMLNAQAFSMFAQALSSYKGTGESTWSKIAGGIAGFFGGGGNNLPIDDFKAFAQADLGDTTKLKNNAEAFTMFGNAMSSYKPAGPGVGQLLAQAVGNFLGAKPPLEQFKDFVKEDIDPKKLAKPNSEAFSAFATALGTYKGTNQGMWGAITEAAGKFLGNEDVIAKFKRFADLAINKEQAKINADAFTQFANALGSYTGTNQGMWGQLSEAVGSFLGNEDTIAKFQRFATYKIDPNQVQTNADAFVMFSNAMAGYSGTNEGMWSKLGDAISGFFGGGKKDTIGDFERFSKINASGITGVSTAIGIMSTQMSGFNSDALSTAGSGIESFVDYLDDGESDVLAVLGPAMQKLGVGLNALSGVQNNPNIAAIGTSLKALVDTKILATISGQASYINTFTSALNALNSALSTGLTLNLNTLLLSALPLQTFQTILQGFVNSKLLETLGTQTTSLTIFTAGLNGFAQSIVGVNMAFAGGFINNFTMLSVMSKGIDMTTMSIIKMTAAFEELSKVNLTSIRGIPWDKMTNFGKVPGGSVILAKNANDNFTIEKNSAKNIDIQTKKTIELDTHMQQLVALNKNIQTLIDAQLTNNGQDGKIQLMIDGKQVTRVINRRADNEKATKP